MKYRKKPVVVEAVRWINTNGSTVEVMEFMHGSIDSILINPAEGDHLLIETLEGKIRADVGDWIIKGVKGEFYPCKPDIFEATYELAD